MIALYLKYMLCFVLNFFFVFEDSQWHIVIGGRRTKSILRSVELFNWQTAVHCLIQDLPVSITGHTGSTFRDVPIFCGGYNETNQVQKLCYQFVNADGTWKEVIYRFTLLILES